MANSISKQLQFWADPRWLQIFLLSNFLIYGWIFLGWYGELSIYLTAITSCLSTQYFFAYRLKLPNGSWKSSLISALGLCLLLKVNGWEWMALAGFLTISSKFLLRTTSKHIFNPTNFGIIALMLLGQGWISPGQWGSGEIIASLITLGAAIVLFGVNRWDVALTFLISLFLFESIRNIGWLGWSWDVVFHKFNSGTILLFAFFMITDPRTSPNKRSGRILWGIMISVLSFGLSQFFYFYQAPLIALFLVSLSTPLIDKYFKSNPFQWNIHSLNTNTYEK
ncbi:Na+-transporting NADH:ubiquinone oxidoreductase, subunit NqrB [Cryomorpha ignava]|uniref:Na+-transporting NADH:ubiquinone oxidoreductase, subunit NqrB n=1 Tax=Cryomorpha ignava TaxID=101383 RepID=A0A7K3WXJ0_9FLAO|nr:RnfABCDGE type electron transport complex subunit D [Cryomorpha ignava]NEN25821.1 Na+-transporting NADH:ubiquinone oxidoreductase, subunit NqrB [Cryomorpha ignava]